MRDKARASTITGMNAAVDRLSNSHLRLGPDGWVAAVWTSSLVAVTVLGATRGAFRSSVEAHLPVSFAIVELASACLLMISTWFVARRNPTLSMALAMTTTGLLLPTWAGWTSLPDQVQTGLLATQPLVIAGTAGVALGWARDSGPSRSGRAVFVLTTMSALVHWWGYNPGVEPGCARTCLNVTPPGEGLLNTRTAIGIAGALIIAASGVAILAIARSNPQVAPRVVAAGVIAALIVLAVPWGVRWAGWSERDPSNLPLALPFAGGILVSISVLMAVNRMSRTRVAVERLVTGLGESGPVIGNLGGAIRGVTFAIPDDGRWVDSMGRPATDTSVDGGRVLVSDPSGPVVQLLVAEGWDSAAVLTELTPATRLALKNAQLSAVIRARVADVRASRRRIVAASDVERRRIERDLHDGAQQRLVSAAFYMNLMRGTLPEDPPPLTRAEFLVRDALGHLRRLAHGVFPSVLASEGLWIALDELVRASVVPARLEVSGDDRVDSEIAMAAYATVLRALNLSGHDSPSTTALVSGWHHHEALEVSIELSGGSREPGPSDFTDESDRVGALGGELTLATIGDRTIVRAALPCE